MNQTISVVVPVYNVEAYLPTCLDSLLNQTYSDLEIIVVDDGSKDRSGEICEQYAAKDSRVRVVHQKNGGAACAKNTALRMATGRYLAFADSDDYVEPDAYAYMLRQLQENDADVIQCAHLKVFTNQSKVYSQCEQLQEFQVSAFMKLFVSDWTCGLLWNKLYERNLFDGIFFEEGHKIDDEYFTYQGLMNARKILRSPKIVYNYRMRKSSVMSSPSSMECIMLDRLDYSEKRRKKVLLKFPQLRQLYDDHYVNLLLIMLSEPHRTTQTVRQVKLQAGSFLKERPSPAVPLRLKIKLLCAMLQRPKASLLPPADASVTNTEAYFE